MATETEFDAKLVAYVAAARHAATAWAKFAKTIADHDRRRIAHRASNSRL